MEILNLQQIIWQAVNFFILYMVIAKFVVPPTKKYLHSRDKEISEGLENAEKVKTRLAEAEKMKSEILNEAKVESQKIIEEMRVRAEELSKKLHEDAKASAAMEAKRIVDQAQADLEKRREELNQEAVNLAALIARKSLTGALDIKLQHELLQNQLNELKRTRIKSQ